MGLTVDIDIDIRALERIIPRIPEARSDMLDMAAEEVRKGGYERSAVKTGANRESIEWKEDGASDRVISPNTTYDLYLELGTRYMAARPYMRPALEALKWIPIARTAFERIGL